MRREGRPQQEQEVMNTLARIVVVIMLLNHKDLESPSIKGVLYFLPAPLDVQKIGGIS